MGHALAVRSACGAALPIFGPALPVGLAVTAIGVVLSLTGAAATPWHPHRSRAPSR